MFKPKRNPEKDLVWLTDTLKKALGERLFSVITFGSIVRGDYDPKRSNLNVLIVSDLSYPALEALGPAFREWSRRGHILPVLVAPDDMDDFARDFPIEFLEMQEKHRLLYGRNPLTDLKVNEEHVEAQCEHDLALVQLRLRQAIATTAGDEKALSLAIQRCRSSLQTLLRIATRLEEKRPPLDKIKASDRLAEIQHLKRQADAGSLQNLAQRYLTVIEAVLTNLRKS